MKMKKGVSLVVLAITIIILIIITGVTIVQISSGVSVANRNDFVTELATIEDKIKEYYLLTGVLPVIPGKEYSTNEMKNKLVDVSQQQILESEIIANGDTSNTFLIIDLSKININTEERGKTQQDTDIFVVANNTLNVYYLKGVELDDIIRFSLVTLIERDGIDGKQENVATDIDLNTQLSLVKHTNVWTKELVITVKNVLKQNETLQYSIAGSDAKSVENNRIVINIDSMTDAEKELFSTNKQVVVNKVLDGNIIETKTIDASNLDVDSPSLATLDVVDSSNTSYNIIKINSLDNGLSGIKCLYYEYNKMLVDNTVVPYYNVISKLTQEQLRRFGKITNDGNIKLDKNIKSIIVMAVDNAGNMSDILTYTIQDTYLISK